MSEDAISQSLERPTELGKSPQAIARRWKLELKLADKREQTWRDTAKRVYKIYTPAECNLNTFNILWPNTETLRQAVYNSLPKPQCKRRYEDKNPNGFKAGEVMTRALEYSQECGDFDYVCQQLVLSMLLAGRGVTWERYVPKISSGMELGDESATNNENTYEEIEWEQVVSEKVQYDDFRILCAAKTWDEVTAVGRRHRLSRADLVAKFGEEIGNAIKLDGTDLDDSKDSADADLFKTAAIWEIWDKEDKKVIFISETYSKPLRIEDDPLGLTGFFPCPRPLYAIESDITLEPVCLYTQYEAQAKELNKISLRINRLVETLRLRGVYDATIGEIGSLMKAGDNELIPAEHVTAILERGGLEKAIWMMPIETAARVLDTLYTQRDATRQVIYELTGISDIMRAASDPAETFGAQKIKSKWGTQRLQRMQMETQRYIRDMIRIKSEIICKKFQMETLEQMTQVELPHVAEIMQQQQQQLAQYQQQAMMAMQQGQPAPPPPQMPPMPPTWESVIKLLKDDMARSYQIDIETDSTLAATQDDDMAGLQQTMTGIVTLVQGLGPAVQSGAIPVGALKELVGVIVRRAKMGSAIEDIINTIPQPEPGQNPEALKAEAAMKQQQMQLQHEQQMEQMKVQAQMQVEQAKAQAAMAKEQAQAQGDAAKEQYRMQADMQIEQQRVEMQMALEREKLQNQYAMDDIKRQYDLQIAMYQQELDQAKHESGIGADMEKARLDSATKIAIAQLNASRAESNKKDDE